MKGKQKISGKLYIIVFAAFLLASLGFYARLANVQDPHLNALLFGLSILGAAFVLSWAIEVAQIDIPRSLAFAVLALIAVLPEYAVDIYFSYTAASNPEYAHYAAANMTGANRLLIGVGWSALVFIHWFKSGNRRIQLKETEKVELSFLFIASLYAFVIVLKRSFSIIDTAILGSLFVLYVFRVSRTHIEEPHVVGPARIVAAFSKQKRYLAVIFMLLFAAATIFLSAEPFAESLIKSGTSAGIDEFFLVQWVAPLASEAPEFVVAIIFVLRMLPRSGFETLLSSKINQWTLLIATIPIAYSLGFMHIAEMQLDQRQTEEVFLTAAQSLFGMALMLDLKITLRAALSLFTLFMIQLAFPQTHLMVAFVYMVLAAILFYRDRKYIPSLMKAAVK